MAVRTKRKLELENTALKGSSPPDSDELAKNMKKSGLNPEDAGLEQPTDKKEGLRDTGTAGRTRNATGTAGRTRADNQK